MERCRGNLVSRMLNSGIQSAVLKWCLPTDDIPGCGFHPLLNYEPIRSDTERTNTRSVSSGI